MASLEDLIRENIDAINRLTAATENLAQLRTEAIEAVKGTAKPADEKKAASKPAKETKPEISENPEDRKPPEEKGETEKTSDTSPWDELGKVIRDFVGMDDDAALRDDRKAVVRKIFAHEKVCNNEKAKHTDVPENMIPTVMKNIEKQKAEFEARAKKSGDDDLLG